MTRRSWTGVSEITKYRSIVGRLMYMAGERPDAIHPVPGPTHGKAYKARLEECIHASLRQVAMA